MPEAPHFTPTEQRIMDLLADHQPHTRREIHKCLEDELAALDTIKFHLCKIRAKVEPHGQYIVCELVNGRVICYRWVYLSPSARPTTPVQSTL